MTTADIKPVSRNGSHVYILAGKEYHSYGEAQRKLVKSNKAQRKSSTTAMRKCYGERIYAK